MPIFWLLQVYWLLLAATLSPLLVVRVCGQLCPPYYTLPPSWCSTNLTEQERRAYHDQPLPYNCRESDWDIEDSENYTLSVMLTNEDFRQCSLDMVEECCPVFKTFAANISLKISLDSSQSSEYLCVQLETPQKRLFYVSEPYYSGRAWITLENVLLFLFRIVRSPGISDPSKNTALDFFIKRLTFEYLYIDFDKFYEIISYHAPSQLHALCYSDNEGYIQTPQWNGTDQGHVPTNSCVTVLVPDNHVIMISFIGLSIETDNDCKSNRLTLHEDSDCRGDGEQICAREDFRPHVFESARNVSIRFITDGPWVRSGFRLLYSFHPRSTKPEKLWNGKWNCSVPYLSDFYDHFLCSLQAFCSDGKDVFQCVNHELCGNNSYVQIEDLCYIPMTSKNQSWNEAADACTQVGGHLAVLSSEAKMHVFMNIITQMRRLMHVAVYVGIKQTSSKAPETYYYTWHWADNTLAVIPGATDINYSQKCVFYTSVLVGMYIVTDFFSLQCDAKYLSNSICQRYVGKPTENDNSTKNLLPKLPAKPFSGTMVECDHNQMAHVFLACDVDTNCSAEDDGSASVCAKTNFTPAMPLFTCNNGVQLIPYSLVCDHRSDCCDTSDEDFCQFSVCDERTMFTCKNNKQCIPQHRHCDSRRDCVDESDEAVCLYKTSLTIFNVSSIVMLPAVVNFTNRSTLTISSLRSSSCPESHFQCPSNGFCMPVYVLCNGVFDCPGMEDEQGCDAFTCPGFYRCRASRICLHHDHLCDGVFQCPQHDDELMCNFTCPGGCVCYGYAFICSASFPAAQYPDLRYLEAPYTSMKLSNMSSNTLLLFLDLRHCNIDIIGSVDLPNLQHLDLSYNRLEVVTAAELIQLKNLRVLSLAYNRLLSISSFIDGFHIFYKLIELNLAGLSIPVLNKSLPVIFPKLQVLNVSSTGLDRVSESGFRSFSRLRQLDLYGCPMQTFFPGVFDGLSRLTFIWTDNYKLCCPSVLPSGFDANNCVAPDNEVSSCDALLRSDAFRVFLTLYAFLSLVGNSASFLYRTVIEKTELKMGFDVFVTHLCVADFLMGVYLAIIGVADRVYYGDYRWNDVTWRHSTACKVAGVLSLMSSEVSAFLICIITLERFLVIRFPLKDLRFRRWSAHTACVGLWILGLLLTTVPLLPNTMHWEFYSQSGICVPLPITRKEFPGGDYAFGVVIGLNFVLFVMIAVGQLLIYWSVKVNTMATNESSKKSKDMAIARRLLAVVMTDFLCWFPIGMLGILAKFGVPIPGDVNVAMAIFVLPFNSALNPFLYTFNMLMERQQKAKQQRRAKEEKPASTSAVAMSSKASTNTTEDITYTEDDAYKLIVRWLEDGVLSEDRVRHCIADVSRDNTRF